MCCPVSDLIMSFADCRCGKPTFTSLLLGDLSQVGESFATLELGILDHACKGFSKAYAVHVCIGANIPASASLEKLPVHSTNVLLSSSPLVTA